jgi:hypothetical protein
MRKHASAIAAVILSCAIVVPAMAAEKTVTCKDGTTSPGGRGACSHHGGVGAPATVTCKDGTTSKPGRGACSHHGGQAKGEAPTAGAPAAGGNH